jgi:hypothetical protein
VSHIQVALEGKRSVPRSIDVTDMDSEIHMFWVSRRSERAQKARKHRVGQDFWPQLTLLANRVLTRSKRSSGLLHRVNHTLFPVLPQLECSFCFRRPGNVMLDFSWQAIVVYARLPKS